MGFTLGITNAPAGATIWTAFFWSQIEGDYIRPDDPLALDEVWVSAVDPEGTTNLHIGVMDEPRDIILIDVGGLGPVNDGKSYVYDASTRQLSEVTPPVTGELLIGLVWWEGKDGWNSILETNTWPHATAILTTWKVKNTGGESAVFKTRLLGVESAEAWLTPGATFWFEQPTISLSVGTHQFTLQVLADDEVVTEFPFQVIVSEVVPVPEFRGTIIKKELEYNGSRKAIPVY